ncbi:hypothetical protein M8C21_029873 [Ambrosia artemisiifolia]|uniref:Uncharacterized protein n=1 Tax=Ambrosia artemisiifolia TaxID=4212 RepID=A0AAD5CDR1_AMBAR|nr:hypothetical protein M8C21_029873 [Ambrosia artemisiifolia]
MALGFRLLYSETNTIDRPPQLCIDRKAGRHSPQPRECNSPALAANVSHGSWVEVGSGIRPVCDAHLTGACSSLEKNRDDKDEITEKALQVHGVMEIKIGFED